MRKALLTILLCWCGLVQGQSVYQYDVEKVVDDVYVLKPKINRYRWVTANIVVIVNDADVLVVDSGLLPAAATEAIKEIKRITPKPVRYLVNTHWHGDHWQGNEVFAKTFPGLEIIASEEGLKSILRNGMVWVREFYPKYFQMMVDNYEGAVKKGNYPDDKPLNAEQLAELRDGLAQVKQDLESAKAMKPVPPTLTFTDKMILRKGGREIQFHYLGIGNTVGDAIIYLPKEKVLIPGDLVVYPSPYESGAFSREWANTSKKLEDFSFQHLIPGHGEVQHDATYLQFLNALFAEIIKQVNTAYLSGKTTADEARTVVTYQTVVDELNKDPRFAVYTKKLQGGFISAAIQTSYSRAIEGKL